MLCEKCNKNEATVFVQQNYNGEKKEYHLCSNCASENYFDMSFKNMFQGFLSNLVSQSNLTETSEKNDLAKRCECEFTFEDIKKIGKLGCSNCYKTFEKELKGVIKGIQGANSHVGKFPKKSGSEFALIRKIESLKNDLQLKILNEEYEEAAKIRDEIKLLEGGEFNG